MAKRVVDDGNIVAVRRRNSAAFLLAANNHHFQQDQPFGGIISEKCGFIEAKKSF